MPEIVIAKDYGGPEVLEVVSVPVVPVGAGEVRIEIRAVGVNPIDWKMYSPGDYGGDPDDLPLRLGYEAAGVVVDASHDPTGATGPINEGDEVIAFPVAGAYASEITVAAAGVVHKPDELSWEIAASIMLAGTTAMHALRATRVRKGETLLLHAAAGGVGQMAVQIAAAWGVRVIGTAAEEDHELLSAWGATPIVFGDGLADRVRDVQGEGIDVAIDLIGTDEALDVSTAFLPDPSRLVTTVNNEQTTSRGVRKAWRARCGRRPNNQDGCAHRTPRPRTTRTVGGQRAGDLRTRRRSGSTSHQPKRKSERQARPRFLSSSLARAPRQEAAAMQRPAIEAVSPTAGRPVAVVGATGAQGGAVTRNLLARDLPVRALARDRSTENARALQAAGANVVAADLDE